MIFANNYANKPSFLLQSYIVHVINIIFTLVLAEMSNLLPIAAAKVLKVPIIVFTSLQQFPIVPVVPSDAIIIGSCVHVAYNASGFGGFYDVGTYVSNSIVLPKLMTDPLERRRDSRKRYREKMALMKMGQPARKRGKKPKTPNSQEEDEKESETPADANDSVASQQSEDVDASAADGLEQHMSMNTSVEETEGETSLETSAIENATDEGVEAAANLIEMAYSETGVNEETMEEGIAESAIKVEILPAVESDANEDQAVELQNADPQENQNAMDDSETTTEVISQEDPVKESESKVVTEDASTVATTVNGDNEESQAADAEEGTPEPDSAANAVSQAETIALTPTTKLSGQGTEMVLTIQEGVNIQKQTYSCSCGRGSGKNVKRTQFCLTLEGGYLTRCACYRNASGCSHRCRCYLCCNPYGTAEAAKATKPPRQVRRFRPRHKVQVIKSRFPSLTFTSPLPKTDGQGSKWLEVDCMAFECLIAAMSHAGLELTTENIAAEFERLCTLSKDDGGILGNTIQSKTLVDITHQLEVVQKNIRTFENLYKKQTELNWFQGMEVVFSTEVVVTS